MTLSLGVCIKVITDAHQGLGSSGGDGSTLLAVIAYPSEPRREGEPETVGQQSLQHLTVTIGALRAAPARVSVCKSRRYEKSAPDSVTGTYSTGGRMNELGDSYLATAIREIREMRGEFERLFPKLDHSCPFCGADRVGPWPDTCPSCKQAAERGEL